MVADEITDDHLIRIGRITVEFAQLEYRLGSIVQELIEKEPIGTYKPVHKFESRKVVSMELMAKWFPEMASDWKGFVDDMTISQGERNQILHSAWILRDGESMIGVPPKGDGNAYTLEALDQVAKGIHQLNDRIVPFVAKVLVSSMMDDESLE